MDNKSESVLKFGLDETVQVLNHGFSDYFVPVQMDVSGFVHMAMVEGIDLTLSRIAMQDEGPVGVGLIARRGWTSRLAGMAVVPQLRRQGVGRWLMARLIEEAKERRDHFMELEVIEKNLPAIRLYENCGFEILRRLRSYRLEPAPEGAVLDIEEIDILKAARMVAAFGLADIPWQLSGESLAHTSPPSQAYQFDGAAVIISNPEAETIALRALAGARGIELETAVLGLLDGLFAKFTGKAWVVPALWPEESGAVLEKIGFLPTELTQFQMRLSLKEG